MYPLFKEGSEISLWCEGKEPVVEEPGPPAKRSKSASSSTRRELFEEVDDIFQKLKEKHSQMAAPRLRLWARLIQSGRCDDYDKPPNILLITRSPVQKSKEHKRCSHWCCYRSC